MSDTAKKDAPVFYSPNYDGYKGSKVALWANKPSAEGRKPAQFSGKIGTVDVQLWEVSGPNGFFFNVKTNDGSGGLAQLGTANAYVNARGFNSLSISMRFDSEAAAQEAKGKLGLNEAIKTHTRDDKTSYFINIYADVSRKAIEANPAEFERLGFKTVFDAKPA